LEIFPRLSYLFLDNICGATPLDGIRHHLSRLKLQFIEQTPEVALRQALRFCGGNVTQLYIEWIGMRRFSGNFTASIAVRMPETTYHITNLHLTNIDILSDPSSGASRLVQLLPLQYLCTEHTPAPSPEGWNALPRTLRRLTMSSYGRSIFIQALSECLSSPTVNVASIQHMELWGGGTEDVSNVENLSSLTKFCREKGIPWSMIGSMTLEIHVSCE
jgi:hypothetical protein